jgi:iron complex transport system permease protein
MSRHSSRLRRPSIAASEMSLANVKPDAFIRTKGHVRRPPALLVVSGLILFLLLAIMLAATVGAAGIPLSRLPAALGLAAPSPGDGLHTRDQLILWSIRLPRIAVAAMIGGILGAAGAIMQGLFRNPLADPALVGVSSGGAFAAAGAIVISDSRFAAHIHFLQPVLLPLAAFLGSLLTTVILYRIATRSGRTSIAIFLLAGLAIAAIANAGIGLLVFIADDRQLRDITFWLLGSLSGATWSKATTIVPVFALASIAMIFIHRGLDVLILGESEAFHSGIDVERLKRICIVIISAMTGVAVSICGVVGFVGIVVPHLLRLMIGPGHRLLLPASIALGAAMLVCADTLARTIVAPAEMPIGILTAAVGAPVFLLILLRQRGLVGL